MLNKRLAVDFWRDKRVVVTGGAGFLGSFVVGMLRQRPCGDVFVPRSRNYNLVEEGAVRRLYNDARPDIVIHLAAACGGIGANMENPGRFFFDNIKMGTQLIDEGRRRGIEKFVAVGTVCSYPKFTRVPFREEDLWNGYPEETNAPYGLAKKMLLVQSIAYREQYGFNSIFLIPANLYGPRDSFDPRRSHVIPAIIRKCFEAKSDCKDEIVCWGDGSPTREFLYVEDCARAILLATEHYNKSEPVNIGTGSEISIKDLVELICGLVGYSGRIIWDTSKPNGQPRRLLDVGRARREFGFEAMVDLKEGLRRTVQWYQSQLMGATA